MAVVIRVAIACLFSMGVENMQLIPFSPEPNAAEKANNHASTNHT
jgi:hypothetical protein